jgi:hypothetical protein
MNQTIALKALLILAILCIFCCLAHVIVNYFLLSEAEGNDPAYSNTQSRPASNDLSQYGRKALSQQRKRTDVDPGSRIRVLGERTTLPPSSLIADYTELLAALDE